MPAETVSILVWPLDEPKSSHVQALADLFPDPPKSFDSEHRKQLMRPDPKDYDPSITYSGRIDVGPKQIRPPDGKYRAVTAIFAWLPGKKDPQSPCSGFLINPTTVVTAAHCLADPSNCLTNRIEVAIGYDGRDSGKKPSTEVRFGKTVAMSRNYYLTQNALYDVAFIEVSQPFEMVCPFEYVRMPLAVADVQMIAVGYPCDLPAKPMKPEDTGHHMYAVKDAEYSFEHDRQAEQWGYPHRLKVYYGNSGGPVLLRSSAKEPWKVVGVVATFRTFAPLDRAGNSVEAFLLALRRCAGRNEVGTIIDADEGVSSRRVDVPVSDMQDSFLV